MTVQTFFEQIKGKKIDISRLNPDPGCSNQSPVPPGWYYVTHMYSVDNNGNITCTTLDKPIIVYGDQDASYMYAIAIFINGFSGIDWSIDCCKSNPVTEINCIYGEQVLPCVWFQRINKSTAQMDENIPIEIENKALSTLPFGNNSNILYATIGIGILTLLFFMMRKKLH